jgi:hypothetical protein
MQKQFFKENQIKYWFIRILQKSCVCKTPAHSPFTSFILTSVNNTINHNLPQSTLIYKKGKLSPKFTNKIYFQSYGIIFLTLVSYLQLLRAVEF